MLIKIRGLSLTSWNYLGQDSKQFRHYGPMAQDFFAAFGHALPQSFLTRLMASSAKSVQMPAGSFWRSRNVQLSVFGS